MDQKTKEQYMIINPSDPYTFEADSREVAALVILAISSAYGAEHESGDEEKRVPIIMWDSAWYSETFGRGPDKGLKVLREQFIEAMGSVMLGSFTDRRRYRAAMEAIDDPAKRKKFREEWQGARSSYNNIGAYCHRLADVMAEAGAGA